MSRRLDGPPPLPKEAVIGGSIVIAVFLLAIVLHTLSAPSGPWSTPYGPSTAEPPYFVQGLDRFFTEYLLRPLRMTHNYHFMANQPETDGVFFEVALKDDKGKELETLKFPDPKANYYVRHRQALLAQFLDEDQYVAPRGSEVIPAPNAKINRVQIWEETQPGQNPVFRLKSMPEHLLPRELNTTKPSEWSMLLAKAYIRYLLRETGAHSAELARHARSPIGPHNLIIPEIMPGTFSERTNIFAEAKQ